MASAAVSNPPRPGRRGTGQGAGPEDGNKGIWSSMLDSVGSGKRLAEKNLLILGVSPLPKSHAPEAHIFPHQHRTNTSKGGTPETQKEFVEALATEDGAPGRRPYDRVHSKRAPIANRFALGYTYQDVLDADQDDILARLSLYLLADAHPAFSALLEPLFSAVAVPDTLVVVLLDWDSPWHWARQLRDWLRILRAALSRVEGAARDALDENTREWTERRKGVDIEGVASTNTSAAAAAAESEGGAPSLGPGAWDEPLGVPLVVVCQRAEHVEVLEREHSWKDDEFDFIQQFLRTVLLKHGAGLVYTASSAPGPLPTLLKGALGIRSLLQRNPLRHNVIDRDKILVPPNWDSWGKIRPLGEAFDVEGVSNAWSLDIQGLPGASSAATTATTTTNGDAEAEPGPTSSAVAVFESRIEDPNKHRNQALQLGSDRSAGIETQCQPMQDFLAEQQKALDNLRSQDEIEANKSKESNKKPGLHTPAQGAAATSKVTDQIGPVQFNMGGIQVDADDMLKTLKERGAAEAGRSPTSNGGAESDGAPAAGLVGSPDSKLEHEKLSSFFAGLMSRSSNSAAGSPRAPRSDRGDAESER